jgi:stage II sporulation protein AA (anti-sigma F factor antagonist)
MPLADVQFSEHGRAVVASLTGEIDLSNAEHIGTAIAEATPNRMLAVVLDLSGVDYLDSAGIGLVYRLREQLRARGQSLSLVVPSNAPAYDALRFAGVESHTEMAETTEQALSGLA